MTKRTLHNNHNVYILGAGFSADHKLPLVSDFMFVLRDAHDWLSKQNRLKEADAIKKVLDFRLTSASAAYRIRTDLENIEELFSLASATTDELSESIRLAIAATLDFRRITQPLPMIRFQSKNQFHRGWNHNKDGYFEAPAYEFYVKALTGGLSGSPAEDESQDTFISFNYDTILEDALTNLDKRYSYGFRSKTVNFDDSVRGSGLSDDANVNVLKLHGSLNWAIPGGRGRKLTLYRNYEMLRSNGLVPELIPPTWRKVFNGQLADIWGGALNAIEQATRLIVIGFSMPPTDMHFKWLLAAGLKNNISLREIVFVNPDGKLINERIHNLFVRIDNSPRIRVIESKLSGFITQGTVDSAIYSIGRRLDPSIQNIYLA